MNDFRRLSLSGFRDGDEVQSAFEPACQDLLSDPGRGLKSGPSNANSRQVPQIRNA
jgi:hypothetical protein